MTDELNKLADITANANLEFLLRAIAREVQIGNWEYIECYAKTISDIQDKVLKDAGIPPPERWVIANHDSPIGKRVRWHPVDTDDTFEGTIIEEKEHLYVVVPDDANAPTQNWSKRTCTIIDNSQ